MNKELIKKYKTEFDHWLDGGKILKHYGSWVPVNLDAKWKSSIPDLEQEGSFGYVINDKFVEIRKALAEGKTVQYNFGNYGINRKDFPDSWKNLDQSIGILADRACPENYRIKPEEPKFKVGDWVVNKTSKQRIIKKVTSTYSDSVTVGNTEVGINVMLINDLELWQPKKGDWCWFWDETLKKPMLLQFERFCSTGFYKYETNNKLNYQYCEPFLGELPTNLKKPL